MTAYAGPVDPTKPKQPDKSLGDLFGELSSEFTDLLRPQVELAKIEIRAEAGKAGRTAAMFGVAAMLGYVALVLLSFAAAWGLATAMNAGFACLIVGGLYAIAAAVLYARGRDRAQSVNLMPEQTVESVEEDVQWARQKLS